MKDEIAEAKRQRIDAEAAANRLLGEYLVQHGRFPKDSGCVPHAALHAERQRRFSLQKRVAELEAQLKSAAGGTVLAATSKADDGSTVVRENTDD